MLLGQIERIDGQKSTQEKLKLAMNLINHTAQDIRGHFWGAKEVQLLPG